MFHCLGLGLWLIAQLPPPVASAQQGTAAIFGQVISRQTKAPVQGATILLVGTAATATSDSAGRFEYSRLVPGPHLLQVRAIGYVEGAWQLTLVGGEVLNQRFELDLVRFELAEVVVEERPVVPRGKLAEFERRRARGMGYFLTREEIEARHAFSLADLLRGVPGVQTVCTGLGCTVRMSRSPRNCRPEYFVDGFSASFATGPDMPVLGVVGIEVYRTATETPAELRRPNLRCGVIAIWTQTGGGGP